MKAVLVERPGGPDVLRVVDLPLPEPGPGEVRVRLHRIGVNFADVLCRRATHRSMRPPPLVCGCEGAGVIDACGPGVTRWSIGDRVGERVGVYSPFGGAYAESLVVPERYALPLPAAMSFDEAAAFTHLALTADAALRIGGTPATGATVLITAAAGGLGGFLMQTATAMGLVPIAAVGSAAKRDALIARGVHPVIDYGTERLDATVLRVTGGRGVDVVVETVGGALFAQAAAALAPLGRIVVAGAASGDLAQPDMAALLDRSATCAALNLSVVYARDPDGIDAAWQRCTTLHAAGRLRARIGRRFALAEAADAHRWLESRASTDKILLEP